MIKEGLILILGLAMLFEWGPFKRSQDFQVLTWKTLRGLLIEAADLFLGLTLLLLLHLLAVETMLPYPYQMKWAVLFSISIAFVFSSFRGRPMIFFLTLSVFSAAILVGEDSFSMTERMIQGGLGFLMLTVFRGLFLGLKGRLFFSDVPEKVAGLPIFLLMAAMLALAFAWMG